MTKLAKIAMWIGFPVIMLVAYLYNLLVKNKSLREQLEEVKLNEKFKEQDGKITAAKKESNAAVSAALDAFNAYWKDRKSTGEVRESDESPKDSA